MLERLWLWDLLANGSLTYSINTSKYTRCIDAFSPKTALQVATNNIQSFNCTQLVRITDIV